jgi:hypothetical protein
MKRISTMSEPPMQPKTTESSVALQEQIRCRAYEIYEQRGRKDGHDVDDWLQAESEIVQRWAKAEAA